MTKYARLASAADLKKVKEGAKHKIVLRHYNRQPSDKKFQILVCGGTAAPPPAASPSGLPSRNQSQNMDLSIPVKW